MLVVANSVVASRLVVTKKSRETYFKQSAIGGSTYTNDQIVGTQKVRSKLECANLCIMSNAMQRQLVCQTFHYNVQTKVCIMLNVIQQTADQQNMYYLTKVNGYLS